MSFPKDFIEQVKNASNIVTVAARYMPLKQKGREYWACCPFHHEKTPSFAINEQNQFYHCFGCGVSGNVFTLVQHLENVDFAAAVEILAKAANIKIPQQSSDPKEFEKVRARERVLATVEAAREFYCENLRKHGAEALKYLHERGVTDALIKDFNIGFSNDYTSVLDHLRKKGFTDKEICDAGIAAQTAKGRMYDAFGERITFSIFDLYNNCIGFTGRILPSNPRANEVAKYRNSAQTLAFDKGHIVYGGDVLKRYMRTAAIHSLIVVEGNVDVITLVGAGFNNTVACMGTAMTQFHARAFKRFSDQVYLCFDGDSAGRKATLRALEILAAEPALSVRVVSLPDNIDPDGFVRKNGAAAFKKLLDDARPALDYKLDVLAVECDLRDNIGKTKYLKEAAKILNTLENVAEVELYAPKIAATVGVSKDSVVRQVLGVLTKKTPPPQPTEAAPVQAPPNKFDRAFDFVAASKLQKKSWAADELEFELNYQDDDEKLLGFEFLGTAALMSKEYGDCVKTLLDQHLKELRDKYTQLGDLKQVQEITRRIKNVR